MKTSRFEGSLFFVYNKKRNLRIVNLNLSIVREVCLSSKIPSNKTKQSSTLLPMPSMDTAKQELKILAGALFKSSRYL